MRTLAMLAAVSALLLGCKDDAPARKDPAKDKTLLARRLVVEIYGAYREWAKGQPEGACPASLEELGRERTTDYWDRPLRMSCGPDERRHFTVVSAGPDGELDTSDDIRSDR